MGRSRGGLTSKIHALVDADGRPIALRLTGGQVHDSQEAEALLDVMPQGATLLADKGYDSNAICEAAASKNAWPTFRRVQTASRALPSPAGSTGSATSSSASSTASNTSAASPLATTSARRTTLQRGGSVCLNSLTGSLSGLLAGDHAAARSGWLKYTASGVRQPRLECGRTLL
jgi:transposase